MEPILSIVDARPAMDTNQKYWALYGLFGQILPLAQEFYPDEVIVRRRTWETYMSSMDAIVIEYRRRRQGFWGWFRNFDQQMDHPRTMMWVIVDQRAEIEIQIRGSDSFITHLEPILSAFATRHHLPAIKLQRI